MRVRQESFLWYMEQQNLNCCDDDGHIVVRLEELPARVLRTRRKSTTIKPPDPRLQPYLESAGFWHLSQVGCYDYDRAFISVLVERWRPETHTFHFPYRDCTITLEDVAFQLGLYVDGPAVSGCMDDWARFHGWNIMALCQDMLGVVPGMRNMKGNLQS